MPYDMKLILPEQALPVFENQLEDIAGAVLTRLLEKGSHAGSWELQAIFNDEPNHQDLKKRLTLAGEQAHIKSPALRIRKIPDVNWLEASYRGFPPIEIGQYYIYGSHIQEPPPADKISLIIDAATAFGTGEHQTTCGCLKALNDIQSVPKTVLDVGCGSGILGMAFTKTYHQSVDAVDIDPESVRVAKENAQKNGIEKEMNIWQSNGYEQVQKSYDLIFCNILAKPLIDMANDLAKHLEPNGVAILSGFLNNQENWVKKAHLDAGLIFVKCYRVNGWSTLVMRKEVK